MTPEGKIKAEVKEFLNSLGKDCWYFMPVPMGYGKRGVPDIICCIKSCFFGIETKKRGEKARPWQIREAQAITAAGGEVWLIDTTETVKEFSKWVRSWSGIKTRV